MFICGCRCSFPIYFTIKINFAFLFLQTEKEIKNLSNVCYSSNKQNISIIEGGKRVLLFYHQIIDLLTNLSSGYRLAL